MNAQKLVSTTRGLSAALLTGLVVVSWPLWGGAVALGVLIGGALMIANFQVLQWTVQRLLSETSKAGAGGFLLVFFLKFALLAGLLTLALWSGRVHILGLFLGCSVIVLAVLVIAPILGVGGLSEDGEHGERN